MNFILKQFFKTKALVCILIYLTSYSAFSSRIIHFLPTGSMKEVQQVSVRFSEDMVALGDPRSQVDPFEMTCQPTKKDKPINDQIENSSIQTKKKNNSKNSKLKSVVFKTPHFKTRWADSQNWILDFDKPLNSGISCQFKLKPELKDLAKDKVEGLETYHFSTSGPSVISVEPSYREIDPDQYFVLLVDSSIDRKSLQEKAYFEVRGMPDKVNIKLIEGTDRDIVLRSVINDNWQWNVYRHLIDQKSNESGKGPLKSLSEIKELENFIVIAANRRFPDSAQLVFHWPSGILSASGVPSEESQQFNFSVIHPFQANFFCERTAPERACNPILNMRLQFSKSVPLNMLKGTELTDTDGKTWIPIELDPLEKLKSESIKSGSTSQLKIPNEDQQLDALTFKAPFPESTKFKLNLPTQIKDDLGRSLNNQNKFPLEVSTDESSSLLKFPATFGILELKADPVLPVSVRNIEKQMSVRQVSIHGKSLMLSSRDQYGEIINWYLKILNKDYDYKLRTKSLLSPTQGTKFQMPKPMAEREFELVGIPLKKPGFYVVEMASPRLGMALTGESTMYVATSALVTDMAVHFKKGRESSLVWVTQLSDAQPVQQAKVTILNSAGKELYKGVTDKNGLLKLGAINYPCAEIESEESEVNAMNSCEVFVFAQKADDLSFVSSQWSKGIESYRYNAPTEYLPKAWGPVVLHTLLDRMVAQPGDSIQMKHILREHRENGFAMMNKNKLPKRVLIVHQGSQKTYSLPFEFDSRTGSAIGKFNLPKNANLGRYSIYLSNTGSKKNTKDADKDSIRNNQNLTSEASELNEEFDWTAQETGHFIVSEYRLPLMKTQIKIQGEPLVSPHEVKADLSAHYLSGGPAKNLKVKLRAQLQPGYFKPDIPSVLGGSDYHFFATPLKEGIFETDTQQAVEESFLKVQNLTLNQNGGVLATIKNIPVVNKIQQLLIEMEYTDPNGEIKTTQSHTTLFPSEWVVGLSTDSWYNEEGKTKIKGVITNTSGQVQVNKPYKVEAFQTHYITHRKRLVGGFYSYDSKSEIKYLGEVCSGQSDQLGRFNCEPKNLPAGSITLQAKTIDRHQRATYAQVEVSIYKKNTESWWVPSDSDRIDLLPERNQYEPGETANIVVRTPYVTSTVLVTVEREGVLDSFVTEIHRDQPIIKVPLKGHYAPNVFVSALVLRGRVGDPKPTALLDLSKPAMKMGLVELKVGWKAHELSVHVQSDKLKYHTREKAEISIDVKLADKQLVAKRDSKTQNLAIMKDAEVAVAVVDESLLRLKDNSSWKLLREMMGQRSLAVSTSSGQNQVVGRRHFGSKAKVPGGGGGQSNADARELFEPVLFWQPKVKLDSAGKAKINVTLNDSVTSFKVIAIATAADGFFGDGSTTIQSSKDLIIYSGFAPVVREGDQIKNAFTIRNTTTKKMKVSVQVSVKSDHLNSESRPEFPILDLQPSQAVTLDLPLTVGFGIKKLNYQITAKDTLSGSEDSLISKVRVEPAVPIRVLQATLFQLDSTNNQTLKKTVKQPVDALMGKGGLGISARSSLVSGLAGVKSYLEDYPYTCLEQQISRAIVLESKNDIQKVIDSLPAYMDNFGLLKFFPISLCGSEQLTRYILNILDENEYKIPQSTRDRLISGLTSSIQGKYTCHSWWDEKNRNSYLTESKILVMETLSRYKAFNSKSISTVQINPQLWNNETLIAWYQLLKRQTEIPQRDNYFKQAETILRSRINYQGSMMNLQRPNSLNSEADWRLFTSSDQEAIAAFGIYLQEPWGQNEAGKMARGIVARLNRGHWDTTMANAWGFTQFKRFSQQFEKDQISGNTNINAGESKGIVNWQLNPKGSYQLLNWPKESSKNNVSVEMTHQGTGKPWIHLETLSAIPLKSALDMGYQVKRKITPVIQSLSGQWQVGDVANIEITITAKADQPWVVIRDAIPAGASHLGTGLDGSSNLLDRTSLKQRSQTINDVQDWPTEFEEKSNTDFIAYAAYLPRGTFKTNYRIRLNSAGEFKLPPTRVEAMYSPEFFGEVPNDSWKVNQ